MLLVSNVPGLKLRGITLDGANKAEALISIYGRCQGTQLEKLQLKNATKFGIIFVNCEGTADSPVRLTDVTITTNKPIESAIRFDLSKVLPEAPKVNAYFDFRGVNFLGTGKKVTTPNLEVVTKSTIELRPGDSLETVP